MKFGSLFVLLALVPVAAAALIGWAVLRRRPQFSLRTLLSGVTLVAVALSAVLTWRWLTTAETHWEPADSVFAKSLLPEPTITEEEGQFAVVYRPRHRGVGYLSQASRPWTGPRPGSIEQSIRQSESTMTLRSDSREYLEDRLDAMRENDRPKPGRFVIHGRVEDSEGRPVVRAIVDLMGRSVYINHFETREDGTFRMLLDVPSGSGYHLPIRQGTFDGKEFRIKTPSFALSDDHRERFGRIQVD